LSVSSSASSPEKCNEFIIDCFNGPSALGTPIMPDGFVRVNSFTPDIKVDLPVVSDILNDDITPFDSVNGFMRFLVRFPDTVASVLWLDAVGNAVSHGIGWPLMYAAAMWIWARFKCSTSSE
jgi:hypothetical protein